MSLSMSSSSSSSSSSVSATGVTVDGVPRFPDRVEDFADWAMVMRAALTARGLWAVVKNGVSGMPTVVEIDSDGSEIEIDYGQLYNDEVEQIKIDKLTQQLALSKLNQTHHQLTTNTTPSSSSSSSSSSSAAAAASSKQSSSDDDHESTSHTPTPQPKTSQLKQQQTLSPDHDNHQQQQHIESYKYDRLERKEKKVQIDQSFKSYAMITLSLTNKTKQLNLIRNIHHGNANEVWRVLNLAYTAVKSSETVASVMQQMTTIQKLKNENVNDFIARVMRLEHQLKVQGETFPPTLIKHYILTGLAAHTEWQSRVDLVRSIDMQNKMTLDELQQWLVSDENRKRIEAQSRVSNITSNSNSSDSAHYASSGRGGG